MKIIEIKDRSSSLIEQLLEVWEPSVRATHLFLSEAEIANIKPYVPQALMGITHLIIAENEGGMPIAFMGIEEEKLEMLFVSPKERGKGLGKALLEYGIKHYALSELAVNEQNPQAKGFYQHMGFEVYKRTDTDEQGNPYPLLYMKLAKVNIKIEIKKLSPKLLDGYLNFFDTVPHNTGEDKDRCYCVGWSSADSEGKDFSTASKRRAAAIEYIKSYNIQGYLAYHQGKVIGWCNANTKSNCYKCQYGRMYMGYTDKPEASPKIKVKSVFCFAVAPEMQKKGIAELLLKAACEGAAQDGFDFIEAYPNKEFSGGAAECMGPVKLFEKLGFIPYYEAPPKLVMRKNLK